MSSLLYFIMARGIATTTALILAALSALHAQDWPQWRGPSRDGIVPAEAVPKAWPEQLARKWTQEIGEGYSSPVVAAGRVYVHSRQKTDEVVSAFDAASGAAVWRKSYPAAFRKNQYAVSMAQGPNATPVLWRGELITFGISGILSAFDADSGALKWRHDYSASVDTSRLFTGTAMSPIVEDGRVILHVGDDSGGQWKALDAASGKEVWTHTLDGPGYASPVPGTFAGTRQLVTLTDRSVVGVAAESGKPLWRVPFKDEWNENIVTPVVAGDMVIVSGIRRSTIAVRPRMTNGKWSAEQIWSSEKTPMYMSSPIVDDGHLYGFSNLRKGQLFCLNLANGAVTWTTEGRAGASAALLNAGPHIVYLTTEGELIVAAKNPDRYQELRRYEVATGSTYAHPVLLGIGVIVRDATSVTMWGF